MLAVLAAMFLAQAADSDADVLHRLAVKANALDMVAVMPEHDNKDWCKSRRAAKLPSRTLKGPFSGAASEAVSGRALRLRERACQDVVFRILVTEWRFKDEEAAKRAETALATGNHNGEQLKSVHRVWREQDRVYFAESGAFMFWDRFVAAMQTLGVPKGSCSHR